MMKIAQYVQASLLLVSSAVLLCASSARGQSLVDEQTVQNDSLKATIKADGSYELDYLTTGWKFEGKLQGIRGDLRATNGTDKIGKFHEIATWVRNGDRTARRSLLRSFGTSGRNPMRTSIRFRLFIAYRRAFCVCLFRGRISGSTSLANSAPRVLGRFSTSETM